LFGQQLGYSHALQLYHRRTLRAKLLQAPSRRDTVNFKQVINHETAAGIASGGGMVSQTPNLI
jgi:hypothetical protein